MVDGIKYLDYNKNPKDISIETYLKVYDAFCEAYKIRVDDIDKHMFSREVEKKILGRYTPEGVDHRPILGGNKSGARLMIIPLKNRLVRFHAYSYDVEHDYIKTFMQLASKALYKSHKPSDLESKLE